MSPGYMLFDNMLLIGVVNNPDGKTSRMFWMTVIPDGSGRIRFNEDPDSMCGAIKKKESHVKP